jgi:hypothetical protein
VIDGFISFLRTSAEDMMLKIDCLEDLEWHIPGALYDRMAGILDDMEGDDVVQDVRRCSFTGLFGWPMFLVETLDDLADVRSFDEGPTGRLSLLEGPSDAFDIAEWVGGGEHALFVTIDGPDGGPQYVVPAEIASRCPYVLSSIEMKGLKS